MNRKLLILTATFAAVFLLFAADREKDEKEIGRGEERGAAREAPPAVQVRQRAGRPSAEPARRAETPQVEPARRVETAPSAEAGPRVEAPHPGMERRGETAPRTESRPQAAPASGGRTIFIEHRPPSALRSEDGRPAPADKPRPAAASGPKSSARPARRSVMRNDEVQRVVQQQRRAETRRNHYYWHTSGGVRYAHYLDNRNAQWYGFYNGRRFYWCRNFADNWWWRDRLRARWLYWWNGYWWWWGPGSAAFVYLDNNYYPYYAGTGVTVLRAPDAGNPPAPPASPDAGALWTSTDTGRRVQVYGERADAFLYDISGEAPVYLAYLGRGAVDVRFTEEPQERIAVYFKEGFALFDLDGRPEGVPPSAPQPLEPPPDPGVVPPMPASAP